MAMYNCENSTLSKKRGLNSISITATNCSVSTPNSNNDWYFGQDASYNYNVAAYNKRMCSNNFSSSLFDIILPCVSFFFFNLNILDSPFFIIINYNQP